MNILINLIRVNRLVLLSRCNSRPDGYNSTRNELSKSRDLAAVSQGPFYI